MNNSLPSPFTRRSVLGGLGAFLVGGLAGSGLVARADSKRVLVLLSDASERNVAIANAFKERLKGGLVMTYDLGQQTDAGAFIADNLRGLDISYVFAVGDLAARAASREFANTPIVHAEVVDPGVLVSRPGLESVSSWPDPKLTLERFAKVVRPLHTVGLLRTPRTTRQVDAVLAAGEVAGIKVVTRPASGASDVENAVAGLLEQADIVWLLPDYSILTSSLLGKALHQAHIEQRIVATWSTTHFAGAQPAALVVTTGPEGVGQAAAGRISELLAGAKDSQPVYAAPLLHGHFATLRRARVTLNKATAAEFDERIR
jgi:ABC-type uncharacterized transport system substrate-binding protein